MGVICGNNTNCEDPTKIELKFNTVISPVVGGGVSSPDISTIRVLDRAEYDSLMKDPNTLYFIKG